MTVDAAPRPAVHVALPGDLIAGGDRAGPRESHVGGVPVLPGAPAGDPLPPSCGTCGDAMVLVLQVWPKEGRWWGKVRRRRLRRPFAARWQTTLPPSSQAHTPLPSLVDRCLLVYACAGDECGQEAGAWAAVRVQRRGGAVESRRPPPPPPPPPAPTPSESDASPPPGDDWGLGAGAGWGVAAAAAAPAAPAPRAASASTAASDSASWWSPPPSSAARTPFRVVWAPEPPPRRLPGPADAHVAALLASYVDDGDIGEAMVEAAVDCGGGGGGGTSAAPAATATPPSSAVGWAGEAYEPDAAPGADAAYLAFAKRLAWAPTQLARHGVGARPLWPKQVPPPPPPPCPACGAARAWELTLVSPLAALMDEAAEWAREAGREGRGAPAAWAWASLAVAACVDSCGGGDSDIVAYSEHVALANE